jgi:multicomponent Na+:H+ antiporter subunit C
MMFEEFLGRYPYYLTVALMAVGLYGMIGKRNLVKKLIGMTIFQTAILLFYIQGSTKWGATVPVLDPALGSEAASYMNPLPHVVVLTAIVVGVGITGVALALLLRIYRSTGSLEEGTIMERMREWQ